jgi:hypothetical protein
MGETSAHETGRTLSFHKITGRLYGRGQGFKRERIAIFVPRTSDEELLLS